MYALNAHSLSLSLFTLSFTTSNLETNFAGNFRKRVRRRETRWGDLPPVTFAREHGVIMDSLMRALECRWMQMG